jgi:hypothetical protein
MPAVEDVFVYNSGAADEALDADDQARAAWLAQLMSFGVPRIFATSFLETYEQCAGVVPPGYESYGPALLQWETQTSAELLATQQRQYEAEMTKLRHEASTAGAALELSEKERSREKQEAAARQLALKMEVSALKKALAFMVGNVLVTNVIPERTVGAFTYTLFEQ